MNIDVPLKWFLSSQNLKKLNLGSHLKKYLCCILNIKFYLKLGKRPRKKSTFMRLIGIGAHEWLKLRNIEAFSHIIFFRTNPLKRIQLRKLTKFRKNFRLGNPVQKYFREEKKMLIKGSIKFRICNFDISMIRNDTVATNQGISPVLHNTEPNVHTKETFVKVSETMKQGAPNGKFVSTACPENTISCLSAEELSKELETLYNNYTFSDIIITCQSQEFRAHKSILQARCPSMLVEGFKYKPSENNVITKINIDSLPVLVVKTLLFYIYTGKLESVTHHLACDLIYAANMYDLQTLKNICMDFLVKSLNDENVIYIYSFSYSIDELLKSHAVKYISQNFLSISKSAVWEQLKLARPDMTTNILTEVIKLSTPLLVDLTDE